EFLPRLVRIDQGAFRIDDHDLRRDRIEHRLDERLAPAKFPRALALAGVLPIACSRARRRFFGQSASHRKMAASTTHRRKSRPRSPLRKTTCSDKIPAHAPFFFRLIRQEVPYGSASMSAPGHRRSAPLKAFWLSDRRQPSGIFS